MVRRLILIQPHLADVPWVKKIDEMNMCFECENRKQSRPQSDYVYKLNI